MMVGLRLMPSAFNCSNRSRPTWASPFLSQATNKTEYVISFGRTPNIFISLSTSTAFET
uniref:Uncharacterized protein n=1 Tax=Arundo donax TaxID=35708 RepID=A0A0A9D4C5_ARUDO